jgi:TolB protein
MVRLRGLPRFVSGGLSVLVVLSLMNCTDRSPTAPGITAAAGGGGGGPIVSSTNPNDAPQDTTLDVVVAGSGFDRGSTAEWAIAGVPSSKVRTNSTRYVSSKQLVANITIALDADTVLYDVLVTTSRGKKGIGTELFRVRPKGPKPPPPPPDPLAPPGRIVFVRVLPAFNMEIFRMDATGANVVNLTNRVGQDYTPAWSPDGSKIVFACAVEICVMNDDGSGIVQLTTNLRAEAPAWSPDGSRIAFHREDPSGNWDIYVMDAGGGNLVRLTTDQSTDGFPDWSPDGTRIAFRRAISGTSQILVMNADGTGVVQLTTGPGGSTPAWSPDGSRLAFDSDRSGRSEIYVMNADGTGTTQVTTAGGNKADWSLDGTRIVFAATRSNNTDIYAINPDGTREVRLTSANESEFSPAWGPSRP